MKKKASSATPVSAEDDIPPGGSGFDQLWEKYVEKPQATGVVAAMQDRARLDWALTKSEDEVPNLLLSWLWFRRYILDYPERCTKQEAQCHILRAEGRSGL